MPLYCQDSGVHTALSTKSLCPAMVPGEEGGRGPTERSRKLGCVTGGLPTARRLESVCVSQELRDKE